MINQLTVQLAQIDDWQGALEDGRRLLKDAGAVLAEAQQAQALRRWADAGERFRRAQALYQTARLTLTEPASIEAAEYRALRALRDEAADLLGRAHAALAEFESAGWIEQCERNNVDTLESWQRAEQARAISPPPPPARADPQPAQLPARPQREHLTMYVVWIILFVIFLVVVLGLQVSGELDIWALWR